jgi:hypothetical protein
MHIGEGDFDAAWQDLLACLRLSRLLARGGSLIESLVGFATNVSASPAIAAWLDGAQPTAKQARDRLRDLQELPPFPSLADKIDLTERFQHLDILQLTRRRGAGVLQNLEGSPGARRSEPDPVKDLMVLDWAPAMRNHNRFCDRLATAMRVEDRADRESHLDRIEADLKALMQEARDMRGLIGMLLQGNVDKTVTKKISDILLGLTMPAIRKVQQSADRAEQEQANRYVAFALATYRADRGHYPAKLDELAPAYLAVVPGDLFTGQGLAYQPSEGGYLLYSLGENGKDDGGHWYDDDPPGDDPRVRLPLPPWKPKK